MSIAKGADSNTPRNKRRKISHESAQGVLPNEFSRTSESLNQGDSEPDSDYSFETPTGKVRQKSHGSSNAASRRKTPLPDKMSVLTEQLEQLLADTSESEPLISTVESTLDRLCNLVRSTPTTELFSVDQAENWLRNHGKVTIPFPSPRPPKDSNLKFRFQSPTFVGTNGFFSGRIRATGPQTVRVEVAMPESSLQEKDYLNLRAFHQRAFYLAIIAAQIVKEAPKDFELHYVYDDAVELLPMLRLRPRPTVQVRNNLDFMVTVGFPEDAFSPSKCNPTKNCVRPKDDANSSELQPTPFYNSCLLSETGLKVRKQMLEKTHYRCEALHYVCRIGQSWLFERGFSSDMSCGGFGINEWRLMSAILLQTGGHRDHALFSDRYSHLQLFKAMLKVLAGRDMTDPWILRATSLSIPATKSPVFYDGQLGFNILYKMSPWSYQMLRQEAQLGLSALNSKAEDNFDLVFSTTVAEPMLQFDEVVSVLLPSPITEQAAHPHESMRKLYAILKRGLGDRISLLNLKFAPSGELSIRKSHVDRNNSSQIQVCLLINPEATSRLVDHGPSADEKEAADDFKNFWGARSELRRFKDGSISESLIWSTDEPVTFQIIRHLVMRHFKHSHATLSYNSHNLDGTIVPQGSGLLPSETFSLINKQYQTLTSTLHQLEGLPLPIRSISPTDPALRSSTTFNPLNASTSAPINVLIQFDSSTRWPDSLPAIQHTKIAFLVKLSDLLPTSHPDLATRVGLENTSSSTSGHLNTSFLDVIYPPPLPTLAPVSFRLRIHHDRELHLLQTALTDKSLHGSVRDQLTSALATHKQHFLAAPIHTTTIRNLVTKFPPLSSTISLLKKWISSHLLSRLIPDETLEIIAAHVFLHPYPWSAPGSATTAFFRCLHFLARWNWAAEPLIVDLSLGQDMGLKEREDMKMRFQAWRKLDPGMNSVVWFVGTSVDETGVVWTQGGRPEKVVAARVGGLAKACLDVVTGKGLEANEDDMRGLFRTPIAEFDFVMRLDKAVARGVDANANGKGKGKGKGRGGGVGGFKNLQITAGLEHDRIGFDPVELYLKDLEKAFGNVALFFYDGEGGGKMIAGLWRPSVLGRKEWRVRMGWSTKPVVEKGEEGKVVGEFNGEAVLAEMKMMGEGIVKGVSVKQE